MVRPAKFELTTFRSRCYEYNGVDSDGQGSIAANVRCCPDHNCHSWIYRHGKMDIEGLTAHLGATAQPSQQDSEEEFFRPWLPEDQRLTELVKVPGTELAIDEDALIGSDLKRR